MRHNGTHGLDSVGMFREQSPWRVGATPTRGAQPVDDEPTQRYQVILSTEDGAVHDTEVDALDAVMAAVICQARYAQHRVTNLHARRIGNGNT